MQEYSLIEIFGSLPVSPRKFSALDPALKWTGKAAEGDDWCTGCGALTPSVPRSHHSDCDSYKDADRYEPSPNPLGDCPDCGSDYGLSIDSSREQKVSAISCCDCAYQFSASVDEESLIERFRLSQPKKLK